MLFSDFLLIHCVIYEKIEMLKMVHFPCNHGNQSGVGSQLWKTTIFGILNYYTISLLWYMHLQFKRLGL